MEVEIVKFDNLGRGLGYIDNKIVFVPKSVPGDIVKIEIVVEKKNYLEGKIIEVIKKSKQRIDVNCPYFDKCGGCDLMHISLSNMLDFKLDNVNSILNNHNIDYNVDKIIKNNELYNYRNKVSLKIVEQNIGFYENNTHNLISINKCLLCKKEINNIINDLPMLGIINGDITIRCNYKDEIILIINTKNKINNIADIVNKHKIVDIILNDECIYGEDYFIEQINDYLFKVSYNSFFQVNNYICSKLFDLLKDYTKTSKKILDFYCGVGTLGIVSCDEEKEVLGVEIVDNAVKDANINKLFNRKQNISFICADTSNVVEKITSDFDTIILDPPRSGVEKVILDRIINERIEKIIYVSCNPITLGRDLKLLEGNYKIENITLLDMFPNTKHVETFCMLVHK